PQPRIPPALLAGGCLLRTPLHAPQALAAPPARCGSLAGAARSAAQRGLDMPRRIGEGEAPMSVRGEGLGQGGFGRLRGLPTGGRASSGALPAHPAPRGLGTRRRMGKGRAHRCPTGGRLREGQDGKAGRTRPVISSWLYPEAL